MGDVWIYGAHAAFWATFLVRIVPETLGKPTGGTPLAPATPAAPAASGETRVAPWSRALVAFHTAVAFPVLYFGVGHALFGGGGVPALFPGQREASLAVTALAGSLVLWALTSFRSWRIQAAIEPGHELMTSGPFALLRNPIYLALDLIALATVLWIPTPLCAVGAVLVALGGDLRARAEEKVLEAAFGNPYLDYKARVRRFLPGVY